MKNQLFILLTIASTTFVACNSSEQQGKAGTFDTGKVLGKVDTANQVSLSTSKAFLQQAFKEDIEKDLMDSMSRTYFLSEVDLNGDGKMETFIGLQGPYFCGSGGCTVILLDDKGKQVNRFTVTDYPIWVSNEQSMGWKNLVFGSRGKQHLMKFNGKAYPSNPSLEPEIAENDSRDLVKLLDTTESTVVVGQF